MAANTEMKRFPLRFPMEVWMLIIPKPSDVTPIDLYASLPRYRWKGIGNYLKHFDFEEMWDNSARELGEIAGTLRALSQTCRQLRKFALELIWTVVHISTVRELGMVRDLIRGVPSIAKHIRSFCFLWDMDGDYRCCDGYTNEEAGTLLEMAFIDRKSLWEAIRKRHGCSVESSGCLEYFYLDGRRYMAPGSGPLSDANMDDLSKHHLERGKGPDGSGEDRLIKSPAELQDCIIEIVQQLSPSLQTFGWCCPVTPMPASIVAALSKLDSITALHIDFSTYRNQVHAVPYWHLTHSLTELSLTFSYGSWFASHVNDQHVPEQDYVEHGSFELPSELPSDPEAIDQLSSAVATRTIIAAARAGHLRCLRFQNGQCQMPFAIRPLLPLWIALGEWNIQSTYASAGWTLAARYMRQLLSHVSRCGTRTSGTSSAHGETLTAQDIQGLQSHFKTSNLPRHAIHGFRLDPPDHVEHYLAWLAQDAELSQKAADAWNVTVVKHGQADKIRCPCEEFRVKA